MKQKQLAKLAAFLVGAMGGAAFGDDHVSGLVVDCSNVGWDCFDECLVKSSSRNACRIGILFPHKASCWSGNRPNPCDLASVHTHPYFLKKDAGTRCHGRPINEERAKAYNNGGMEFSGVGGDNDADRADGVDGYLGVSDRSCVKANRVTSGFPAQVVAGSCTPTPLPHVPWIKQK